MKTLFTLSFFLFNSFLLSAQQPYHKFSAGAGIGLTHSYSDLRTTDAKQMYSGMAEYYFTPYIVGQGELMAGSMAGQGLTSDRYFKTNFKAATGTLKIYLGHFTDKYRGAYYHTSRLSDILAGLYAGAGAGFIKNVQTEINRKKDNPLYRGWDTDRDLIFPLSAGIDNSSINPRIVTGIRYQHNFALGDNVDGYAISGTGRDMFSTVTISMKYKFGPQGLY